MTSIRMVETECKLCGSDANETVVVGVDREHDLPGEFSVVRCSQCTHHRLNPRPAGTELGRLYPDDYRPFAPTSDEPPGHQRAPIRRRVADFLHFGPSSRTPAGRLLEIGCGRGDLLERFSVAGWQAMGIEPSPAASASARERGLDVRTGTDALLDAMAPDSFELLHAFMVLEHTPDPVETLRRLHRVATVGAKLRVSVPNFESRSRKRFGSCWYALQLPRHFQHFSPSSIRNALEQAGWEVERIWFQPTNADLWQSIEIQHKSGAAVDRLGIVARWSRIIDVLSLPARVLTAQLFGSSRMTITARAKPGTEQAADTTP